MSSPVRIDKQVKELKRQEKYQNYMNIQKRIMYTFSIETLLSLIVGGYAMYFVSLITALIPLCVLIQFSLIAMKPKCYCCLRIIISSLFILRSICYIYIITVLVLAMFGCDIPKIANITEEDIHIYIAVNIILAIIPTFGIFLACYSQYYHNMIISIREGTKVLLPTQSTSPTIIYRPFRSPLDKEDVTVTPISTVKETIISFDNANNKNVVFVDSIPFNKTQNVIRTQK